jgi:hypothetical protein
MRHRGEFPFSINRSTIMSPLTRFNKQKKGDASHYIPQIPLLKNSDEHEKKTYFTIIIRFSI